MADYRVEALIWVLDFEGHILHIDFRLAVLSQHLIIKWGLHISAEWHHAVAHCHLWYLEHLLFWTLPIEGSTPNLLGIVWLSWLKQKGFGTRFWVDGHQIAVVFIAKKSNGLHSLGLIGTRIAKVVKFTHGRLILLLNLIYTHNATLRSKLETFDSVFSCWSQRNLWTYSRIHPWNICKTSLGKLLTEIRLIW